MPRQKGFMGKHNDKKGPTERVVEFVGISGDGGQPYIAGRREK